MRTSKWARIANKKGKEMGHVRIDMHWTGGPHALPCRDEILCH